MVILLWHRFQPTLMDDVDALMALAVERDLLDHAVVVDATRSAGGSLGAYAVQPLQPKPFRTTFGTLRVSDVIPAWVEEKRAEIAASGAMDGPECGSHLDQYRPVAGFMYGIGHTIRPNGHVLEGNPALPTTRSP